MITNICIILALLAWVAYLALDLRLKATGKIPSPAPVNTGPQVTVNVPADFKPMEAMPPTQIEGAKAQLFYAVYCKAVAGFTNEGTYGMDEDEERAAYDSANAAVKTVFGS